MTTRTTRPKATTSRSMSGPEYDKHLQDEIRKLRIKADLEDDPEKRMQLLAEMDSKKELRGLIFRLWGNPFQRATACFLRNATPETIRG